MALVMTYQKPSYREEKLFDHSRKDTTDKMNMNPKINLNPEITLEEILFIVFLAKLFVKPSKTAVKIIIMSPGCGDFKAPLVLSSKTPKKTVIIGSHTLLDIFSLTMKYANGIVNSPVNFDRNAALMALVSDWPKIIEI
jgi:hypothetical protein